jgi:peroxiredoxin
MKTVAVLLAASLMLSGAGQFSNRRAPGFSLADSGFRQHDLQDYRGKIVLLDLMVTSCPYCQQLSDTLVRIKKKYGDRIEIISIVTLPDTFDTADAFAAKHGMTWPIVFDSGQVIASYLEVTPSNPTVHFPHLFVIDGTGMIRNDFESADDLSLTESGLSAVLDPLLTPATKL